MFLWKWPKQMSDSSIFVSSFLSCLFFYIHWDATFTKDFLSLPFKDRPFVLTFPVALLCCAFRYVSVSPNEDILPGSRLWILCDVNTVVNFWQLSPLVPVLLPCGQTPCVVAGICWDCFFPTHSSSFLSISLLLEFKELVWATVISSSF